MGHFSMEIYAPTGSNLNGNQHSRESVQSGHRRVTAASSALLLFGKFQSLPASKR